MAKTTAPLLSFGAKGQIGKSMVMSSWKGRNYARQLVTPANPQTTAQTDTRGMFTFINNVYRAAPLEVVEVWQRFATGQVITDRNGFLAANIAAMRNAGGAPDSNLSNFIFSNGAKSGIPPVQISVTPGAGQLTVAIGAPASPPTGWTITYAVAAAIRDQDPVTGQFYDITAGQDTTSPYSIVLTGLTAAQLYRVGAWLKWAKPDTSEAFSVQLQGAGTPT